VYMLLRAPGRLGWLQAPFFSEADHQEFKYLMLNSHVLIILCFVIIYSVWDGAD
jgi:hypothetical protein